MNISLEWLVVIITLILMSGLLWLGGTVTHWLWKKVQGKWWA